MHRRLFVILACVLTLSACGSIPGLGDETADSAADGAAEVEAEADSEGEQPAAGAVVSPATQASCADGGGTAVADRAEPPIVSCVGPALLDHAAVESSSVRFDPNIGFVIDLVFFAGADGIDAFNEAANECFLTSPVCPTGQLAIVADDRVVSAPMIQAPVFARDQILLSGDFDEQAANDIATAFSQSGSFRPVLVSPVGG